MPGTIAQQGTHGGTTIQQCTKPADLLVFPEDHFGFDRAMNSRVVKELAAYAIEHHVNILVGGRVIDENNSKTASRLLIVQNYC
jgi:apolipoprotein N-acyltransferase